MELFRISTEIYANKLTASGASNRWNKRGEYVIYAGSSRSLSTLELVVHRNAIKPLENYKVMIISVADQDYLVKTLQIKYLPENWRKFAAYSELQGIGSAWYNSKESLLLKVPSAVISEEYNYLINTEHPDFVKNVKLVRTENYFWDERLL
jgi:RES domain-containing protein